MNHLCPQCSTIFYCRHYKGECRGKKFKVCFACWRKSTYW